MNQVFTDHLTEDLLLKRKTSPNQVSWGLIPGATSGPRGCSRQKFWGQILWANGGSQKLNKPVLRQAANVLPPLTLVSQGSPIWRAKHRGRVLRSPLGAELHPHGPSSTGLS